MREFRQPDVPVQLSNEVSGSLAVYAAGGSDAARTLLYLHGSPANARMWKRYLVKPVEGTRTLLIDRPGYGGSAWPAAPFSFAEQARAIAQALPESQRPVLHAHSFGAPIAAHIAAENPDRIAGLIVAGGLLNPVHRRLIWGGRTGLAIGLISRAFRQAGRELINAPAQAEELRATLCKIRVPTLIVHGTRDRLVPYSDVDVMQTALSGAPALRTITLKGAGHFYPWFNEKDTRRIIAAFVSDLDSPD